MADTQSPMAAETSITSKSGPKKGKASPKKPKTKKVAPSPSHPKVSEMVVAAVASLKERGGSSLQAIKKYLAANYKVDVEKLAPFIRKYLKGAVADGTFVQTKGTGANGSFKLGAKLAKKEKKPKAAAKPAAEAKKTVKPKKRTAVKKVAKPTKKAAKSPKKATKSPKKPTKSPKKPQSPKKAKSPQKTQAPKKEKKAKSPKKPKSPKPKKAVKKTPKK